MWQLFHHAKFAELNVSCNHLRHLSETKNDYINPTFYIPKSMQRHTWCIIHNTKMQGLNISTLSRPSLAMSPVSHPAHLPLGPSALLNCDWQTGKRLADDTQPTRKGIHLNTAQHGSAGLDTTHAAYFIRAYVKPVCNMEWPLGTQDIYILLWC